MQTIQIIDGSGAHRYYRAEEASSEIAALKARIAELEKRLADVITTYDSFTPDRAADE